MDDGIYGSPWLCLGGNICILIEEFTSVLSKYTSGLLQVVSIDYDGVTNQYPALSNSIVPNVSIFHPRSTFYPNPTLQLPPTFHPHPKHQLPQSHHSPPPQAPKCSAAVSPSHPRSQTTTHITNKPPSTTTTQQGRIKGMPQRFLSAIRAQQPLGNSHKKL